MTDLDHLTADLPDPESARRFLSSLEEQHRSESVKLKKNDGLLSDAVTLAAYSPLLAATLLQNPEYLWWLNRKRRAPAVRTKDELLEALGRFVLTHSQLDLHTQLARFRRRELLRIFLSDIRRLTTMAEITEDISNLADAILETALRAARQEMENRFGSPQVIDQKGRKTAPEFCIVSLGKLGSRELNYSSDIDLLFLYSSDGETSGSAARGTITNREYFVKLSEAVVQLVGKQSGEGAAYRVDMRLRPHGRVGPLAISVDDAVRYYGGEARDWERQVLIRSRSSAGEPEVYKHFFERVEDFVFVSGAENAPPPFIRSALENVRRSKQLIDREQKPGGGFNVKLGRGGIREIEFIAQALQLAYGGNDRWLRAPHTLISLSRLSDRDLITEAELTELFNAYEFLRHLEHVLQMENGLQTHTVPDESDRRALIGRKMRCETVKAFNAVIGAHTGNVHRIFERVFLSEPGAVATGGFNSPPYEGGVDTVSADGVVLSSGSNENQENDPAAEAAPNSPPGLRRGADASSVGWSRKEGRSEARHTRDEYLRQLHDSVAAERDFRHRLGAFRRRWSALLDDIKTAELAGMIDARQSKRTQTKLAEASIDTALDITREELGRRYKTRIEKLPIAVIGLGKLGGAAIDYGSDLDLVLVYDDVQTSGQDGACEIPDGTTAAEFYSRAAEIFVTTLSSMTRDGSIYRVDLRLRPYGKNGQSVISAAAFADYMRETASIWEWLAYVKIRGVAGDMELAKNVETDMRAIIHARANETDAAELGEDTRRVRLLLEKEKAGSRRRAKDIDIKYGAGGMLDVYFAMRFLQLRDDIPDKLDNRSTEFMLDRLRESGSLSVAHHDAVRDAYRFLSSLDHQLRLVIGRTTRLPVANEKALDTIAERMHLKDHTDLTGQLTLHRLNLRKAFDEIVGFA